MVTNKNKSLGTALENRVVQRARKRGLQAHRQPLSGVLKEHPNDVVLEFGALGGFARLLVECKVRSTHPSLTELLSWLYRVQENAAASDRPFSGALVVYNTKGEQMPKVLMDLDLLLDLLADLDTATSDTATLRAVANGAQFSE